MLMGALGRTRRVASEESGDVSPQSKLAFAAHRARASDAIRDKNSSNHEPRQIHERWYGNWKNQRVRLSNHGWITRQEIAGCIDSILQQVEETSGMRLRQSLPKTQKSPLRVAMVFIQIRQKMAG
jgi:hypothetical protein